MAGIIRNPVSVNKFAHHKSISQNTKFALSRSPSAKMQQMDVSSESSVPKLKEIQIHSSCVPMTPVKRIVQRPQITCTERRENQLGQENQFALGTLDRSIAAYCESLKLIDIDNGFTNWESDLEMTLQNSAGVQNRSEFFMEPNRLKSGPLANLRTLVDVEKNSARAMQKENINAASSSIVPIFESTCEDNPPEVTSTTSSPANEDGNSTPPRPTYELNFLPRTTLYSSMNISSLFSPITPDQSKRAENKEAHDILTLNGGRENQESEKQENNVVDTSEFEVEEVPKALYSAAVSTQLHEGHNPDKAGNLAIDLNRTPQQKPRRKHRPKVVIEGKPKRTPKPAGPTDTPTGKRKYVRKNKLDKTPGTPTSQTMSRTTDPESAPTAAKFCKRKLNFDSESQMTEEECYLPRLQSNANAESESHVQNLYTRVEANSNVQTRVGITYELACSVNNVVEECISAPSPQTPTRTNPLHENSKARDQNASTQGKCQIIFSDETHDKQESIIQGMRYEGERGKRLERGNSCMSYEVNPTCTNVSGGHYNPLPQYWAMFPAHIYNTMGIPGMWSNTSSTLSTVTVPENTVRHWSMNNGCGACTLATAQFISSGMSTETASVIGVQGKEQTFEWKLAVNQKGRISKKRAKGPTAIGNFGSLIEFVECRNRPPFRAEGGTTVSLLTGYELLYHLPAGMDATIKRKKQTKRNTFANSEIIQKKIPSANEIAEQLKSLDITNQEQRSLVPYYIRYEDKNAPVLYQRHGTVVPFEGSFDPVRKRKPRPKIHLDEETNRVWKLLLENINSEGIDGTYEEKVKWWEEERRVFQGRADSFIARMHLVQGDRRFSPWKGSVLDSVIGVFLTQNVSDHLSSSAFMSLAARFPLKSKSNERPCYEETSVLDKETEVCIMDPEDTINWKWREEKSSQLAYNRSYLTFHDTDYFSEKFANNNESLGCSSGGEKSVDNLDCRTSDISGDGIETHGELTADGKVIQHKQEVGSSTGDNRKMDDVLSCLYCNSSSQNSVDSSVAQTAERIGSFFHDNSEAADPSLNPNLHSLVGSSFTELLKRQEKRRSNHKTENLSSYEANGHSCTEHGKQNQRVQQVQEVSNLSRETLDAIESNSSVNKPKNTDHKDVESYLIDHGYLPGNVVSGMSSDSSKVKRGRIGEPKQNTKDWDRLRFQAQTKGTRRERTTNTMDSLDWEAVRCADVNEIAYTIRERGMNNRLAERIKDFLNRLVQDHGSIDLEWLRDVPPDKAKEYLLSVRGLGLKSVECVRLLTLHHLAFPVDTNVGRIAVRLGWVPLQPLPESLQLHLLELYPVLESIQRYLWPRLCKLDQRTLYQLHYQMITFGKVFCTKSKPNCNACPMKGECRHFASAFASARLALPAPEEKSIVNATESKEANQNPMEVIKPLQLPLPQANQQLQARSQINHYEPIVEMPATPEPIVEMPATPEPIVEVLDTPELEQPDVIERDIEDAFYEDPEEIPMIKLNIEAFTQNLQHYMQQNMELCEGDISKALVALSPEAASIPMPKLKYINRLRTEHQVYELPDSHPVLEALDNRDPDDTCSYLLAIWTPGETANSIEQPEKRCSFQEYGKTCDENTCFSCNTIREENSQIVRGTILIPCRTAMRGSFPLNGTYFQVNEVFADHESSINPIDIPRRWIWNLPRRTVFFGTSIPTIFRGLSTESIQYCFWRGFVCVRGFEWKTRAPRPLMARLHFPVSKLKGTKGDNNVKRE